MLRSLRLLAASSLVLVVSSARAQTPPPQPPPPQAGPVSIETPPTGAARGGDTLVLKDGTTLRGTIREMTPGQNVTITLADGQSRTVAWSAVASVDIDRARATAAPPAAPVQATTTVHLEGARPGVVLQALDERGTEGKWQTVCEGACDRELSAGGLYRIDGPGLRTSKPFRLAEGPRANYHVETASSLGFAGGLSLVIVGGVALVNGIAFFLLDAIYKSEGFIVPDAFLIAGGVLTAGGVAALIPGVFLMKANGRTTATVTDGATPVRMPAWREPRLPSWQPRIATIGIPLWGGTF